MDALEQPGDPLLLVLEGGGHEEHLLGRRGVEADLARRHALARTAHVLTVELGTAPWRIEENIKYKTIRLMDHRIMD